MKAWAAGLAGLLLAAPWLAAAKEHIVRPAWSAEGAYRGELRIAPARFKEVCADLAAGDRVRWSFRSDEPAAFNIHFHEGEKTVFPARKEGAREEAGVLEARVSQVYCWMWRAPDRPASIEVLLEKSPAGVPAR